MAWRGALILTFCGLLGQGIRPVPSPPEDSLRSHDRQVRVGSTVSSASVEFSIGPEVYAAKVPPIITGDTWLAGPLVSEARATVSPTRPDGQAHPFLRVLFDVRCYADGQARLDITVENILDKAGAATVTYDVEIRAGAKLLFRHAGVTHYYLTRWRKVFGLPLSPSHVTPDFTPFHQANALPPYLSLVSNTDRPPIGKRFDILQGGDLVSYMPEHGGRPEIAPYPDWIARYLVHKSPMQRDYMLATGDLAGSWPVHVREASDGRLVSINERPNFWFDPRAYPGDKPAGTPMPYPPYQGRKPDPARSPLIPDRAHVPSLAYVPYLVTGDRYYADEMKFWANYGLLATWQKAPTNKRGGSQGLLYHNEVRGFAWVLRNLTDAAAYLPDADPMRAYFANKVANNLDWLANWAQTKPTPLGPAWIWLQSDEPGPNVWVQPAHYAWLAWAIDHANRQGFQGGLLYRDQIAHFFLKLFTSPEWSHQYATAHVFPVGDVLNARAPRPANRIDPTTDRHVRYYTTLAQAYHTFSAHPAALSSSLVGVGYGTRHRLALLIAAENGWGGAREANDLLQRQIAGHLSRGAGAALDLSPPPPKGSNPVDSNDQRGFGLPIFRLTSGWATFGIALPPGAARTALRIGNLTTQTDIKTRWPDGSIRFAVLTAAVSKSGIYSIENGNE